MAGFLSCWVQAFTRLHAPALRVLIVWPCRFIGDFPEDLQALGDDRAKGLSTNVVGGWLNRPVNH